MTEKIKVSLYNGEEEIIFYPKSHRYKNAKTGDWLKSVTAVTGIIDKPGLMYWSVRCMKEYLLEWVKKNDTNFIARVTIKDQIEKASKEWVKVRDEAADFGSEVHDWVESFIKSKLDKTNPPELPSDSKKEVKKGVLAFLRWYNDNKVEFLQTEKFVYSREYQYVGTCDCVAIVNGDLCILDWKTSNSLQTAHVYQTVGYGIAYEEETGKKLKGLHVVHFDKQTGNFGVFTISKQIYEKQKETFLACLIILRAEQEMKKLIEKVM